MRWGEDGKEVTEMGDAKEEPKPPLPERRPPPEPDVQLKPDYAEKAARPKESR